MIKVLWLIIHKKKERKKQKNRIDKVLNHLMSINVTNIRQRMEGRKKYCLQSHSWMGGHILLDGIRARAYWALNKILLFTGVDKTGAAVIEPLSFDSSFEWTQLEFFFFFNFVVVLFCVRCGALGFLFSDESDAHYCYQVRDSGIRGALVLHSLVSVEESMLLKLNSWFLFHPDLLLTPSKAAISFLCAP